MSWCVILHIMAKETHLETKNSFVILPTGMAIQFPAFLSSILFVCQFFCHMFLLLLFCVSFCLLFFVCYFSGWYGKLVSCLPVKYFVCLNNFFCHMFLLCYFFFFFSVLRFVCCFLSVIFPVGMENQFPVFPSHYRQFACADAPLSTNSFFLQDTGKKKQSFLSVHKQNFTESLMGFQLIILLLLFCSALLFIETDLRETLKDLE